MQKTSIFNQLFLKFNQILPVRACSRAQLFGSPPSVALGRGKKVKYHLISFTKSISKIFKPNFVCLLANERYISYLTRFSFVAWVMPQGWDLGVLGGGGRGGWRVKNLIFPEFNQIWFVSYSHEWHVQRHNILVPAPWGLGEGPKGGISLNFNYKVNSKKNYTKLCVSSNK